MMLKNTIIPIILLFVFTSLSAQNLSVPDKRLNDCFTQAELSKLVSEQPELIAYYNYYLDHSYYVVYLKKASKPVTGTDIHTVKSRTNGSETPVLFKDTKYSKETFNPLKYNFKLELHSFATYLWKEAGVAIVFYPISNFSADYKNFQKNLKN
jgi:hypothetical protein